MTVVSNLIQHFFRDHNLILSHNKKETTNSMPLHMRFLSYER